MAANGCGVYIPRVDEDQVPCPNGFSSTDCVYLSDKANASYLGLDDISNVTDFINGLVEKMREQDRVIRSLNNKIERLSNN